MCATEGSQHERPKRPAFTHQHVYAKRKAIISARCPANHQICQIVPDFKKAITCLEFCSSQFSIKKPAFMCYKATCFKLRPFFVVCFRQTRTLYTANLHLYAKGPTQPTLHLYAKRQCYVIATHKRSNSLTCTRNSEAIRVFAKAQRTFFCCRSARGNCTPVKLLQPNLYCCKATCSKFHVFAILQKWLG